MKCIKNKSEKLTKLTERMHYKYLYNLYERCRDNAKQGLHHIIADVYELDGSYYVKVDFEKYVPYEAVKEYFESRGYKIELLTYVWGTPKSLYIRW